MCSFQFFADIFRNNCLNIGVLPVQVSSQFLSKLFQEIYENPNSKIEVDLPNQTISILNIGLNEKFEINNYKKQNMLNGFDDIDYLINIKSEIEDFAKKSII